MKILSKNNETGGRPPPAGRFLGPFGEHEKVSILSMGKIVY